jgi:hypothetical protein
MCFLLAEGAVAVPGLTSLWQPATPASRAAGRGCAECIVSAASFSCMCSWATRHGEWETEAECGDEDPPSSRSRAAQEIWMEGGVDFDLFLGGHISTGTRLGRGMKEVMGDPFTFCRRRRPPNGRFRGQKGPDRLPATEAGGLIALERRPTNYPMGLRENGGRQNRDKTDGAAWRTRRLESSVF